MMGRAGEPGRRGRNGGRRRGPLGRYPEADGPPALRCAHPSGLGPLGLPPPAPRPPAGPQRHLPYLRSPGPPFYFLKPSHKAPRRPGLAGFLPETPARAHSVNRLRARRAGRACALSPARHLALDRGLGGGQAPNTRLRTNRPRLPFPPTEGGVDRAGPMRRGPGARPEQRVSETSVRRRAVGWPLAYPPGARFAVCPVVSERPGYCLHGPHSPNGLNDPRGWEEVVHTGPDSPAAHLGPASGP